jgi:hypothetical protein
MLSSRLLLIMNAQRSVMQLSLEQQHQHCDLVVLSVICMQFIAALLCNIEAFNCTGLMTPALCSAGSRAGISSLLRCSYECRPAGSVHPRGCCMIHPTRCLDDASEHLQLMQRIVTSLNEPLLLWSHLDRACRD